MRPHDDGERSNHFCGYQNLHQQQVTTNPASKIAERETKAVMLGANPGRTLLINFDMKYIDADKLKSEIQSLIDFGYDKLQGNLYHVISLIDSLQQEQPEVDLEKEMKTINGRDADMIESIEMWLHEIEPKWVEKELDWLEELRTRLAEEPVSEDLEEAADNHIRKVADAAGHPGWDWETQDIAEAFIAGAEWQKAKMMDEWLKDRDGCFWDGVNEGKKAMKEQMMEWLEGKVNLSYGVATDAFVEVIDKLKSL